jgi:hypothetical protein
MIAGSASIYRIAFFDQTRLLRSTALNSSKEVGIRSLRALDASILCAHDSPNRSRAPLGVRGSGTLLRGVIEALGLVIALDGDCSNNDWVLAMA